MPLPEIDHLTPDESPPREHPAPATINITAGTLQITEQPI